MKKKEAIQLGVTAVAAIALVIMSIPLFKGRPGRRPVAPKAVSQPATPPAVSQPVTPRAVPQPAAPRTAPQSVTPPAAPQPPPKAASAKKDFQGPVIKVQPIKDDKFYERFSRVVAVLPLDRDPFSFAYTGTKSLREGLELAGILWESGKPTAIISQSFFSIGDSNDQFTVVDILQDRVILKDRTGEFSLRLKQK